MSKIYCFANHKGGTGKSTTTLNVGAGLVRLGKKVLLIDLDPQTNLTVMLGIYSRPSKNLYELFSEECKVEETILSIKDKFDLLPSSLDLSGAELEISNERGRETKLKRLIAPIVSNYDYVLIDAPPSMSLLTINGLVASQKVFIPVQTEFIALNGLAKFVEIINKIKALNPELQIGGVIATRYDNRKVLNRGVVEKIKELFGNKLLNTIIRENIAVAESVAGGLDIFSYAPKSYGAEDFSLLVNEIIKIQ
ncbi:MAG: ParA family protein [Flavobacteriaceae bacterium]